MKSNSEKKPFSLFVAILPIVFLILFLVLNLQIYGADSSSGPNQFALLLTAAIISLMGVIKGFRYKDILEKIAENIGGTTEAIFLLLLIGALSGTWLLSGIIPAMVYYGLQILNPSYFLPATLIICSIVSLATGSSWSTVATVGIALLGIGKIIGFHEGVVAGAIISGAYFGDKLSPMSDTTNLAAAMSGADLFKHIKYMAYTTVPSFIVAFIFFLVYGLNNSVNSLGNELLVLSEDIKSIFHVNGYVFIVPAIVIFLIIKKVPATAVLLVGILGGAFYAYFFQDMVFQKLEITSFTERLKVIFNVITGSFSMPNVENETLATLLKSKGMYGMLNTIWLILSALAFGGALEATGMLYAITNPILRAAKTQFGLFSSTVASCLIVNATTSDQYLSILIPGKMFRKAFDDQGLSEENLSRTLEDSGTVTSVLVPWNTCGATQQAVLGVNALAFIPYCIFNIVSPITTLVFAYFNIKIKKKLNNV